MLIKTTYQIQKAEKHNEKLEQILNLKQEIGSYILGMNALLSLNCIHDAIIAGFVRLLEFHDIGAEGHSYRVAALTTNLARELGFDGDALTHIYHGALLHDIGKLGISSQILQKQGPLTTGEREIIQTHPSIACKLLEKTLF